MRVINGILARRFLKKEIKRLRKELRDAFSVHRQLIKYRELKIITQEMIGLSKEKYNLIKRELDKMEQALRK